MEPSDESTAKMGLTKRKPTRANCIIDSDKGSSNSDTEAKEQMPPSPLSTSSKVGDSHDGDMQNNEDDSEQDKDSESILPEGSVLVVAEAVDKINNPFKKSAEFKAIYKKLKAEGNVGEMIICCTSCSTQINHKMTGTVFVHPLLHVVLCKKCLNFYNSGGFTKDENGIDEYCRWCAEGGDLLCCDTCPHAFCKACIRRNLGRSELSKISKLDEWQCLICDPSPLLDLQATCMLVLNYLKKESKRTTEKGLSHKRSLFSSPSVNMSHRVAIEICMENAVQAGRFLRDGVGLLRKKLAHANEPNIYAERVGKKLKKFLEVTKENLDSVGRAVDRELAKILPVEQSNKLPAVDNVTKPKPSSCSKHQEPAKIIPTKNIKAEISDSTDSDFQHMEPEDNTVNRRETEVAKEPLKENSKCSIKNPEEMIHKDGQETTVKEEPLDYDEFLDNVEAASPDTDISGDITEEYIEESESVENVTPIDDNVQEEHSNVMPLSGDEVDGDATILDNDATLLAPNVVHLKNNDTNRKTKSMKPTNVGKKGGIHNLENGLKIVLKKMPATNDLDQEIVKNDKSKRKRSKRSQAKESEKPGGKPSRTTLRNQKRATSVAEKDSMENLCLEDSITANADNNGTVSSQMESSKGNKKGVEDLESEPNDTPNGIELNDITHKLVTTDQCCDESNSDTETLAGDNLVAEVVYNSPTDKSDDEKRWDMPRKRRSSGSCDVSDAETLLNSFNPDYEDHLLKKSLLEDFVAASGSDSGNDAAIGDDPINDSGSESEAGKKNAMKNLDASINDLATDEHENLGVDKEENNNHAQTKEDNAASESMPGPSVDQKCLFSDISDGDEQETTKVKSKERLHKASKGKVNPSKKSKASDDRLCDSSNTAPAVSKDLPSDKNKTAKKDLLNRLLDDSDDDVEERDQSKSLEKKLGVVTANTKTHSSEGTANLTPSLSQFSLVKNLHDTKVNRISCTKDDEMDEAALAKKKLLSCLQSDSDDDDFRTDISNTAKNTMKKKPSKRGNDDTPAKSSPDKHRIPKPKSARSIHSSSSGSSLSSDEEVAVPKTKAARKIIPIADIQKFIAEDPKLKLEIKVVVQRLKPGVMKQLATCGVVLVKRKQKAILSDTEALNRDINRLCNLKTLKKRKKSDSDSAYSDGNADEVTKAKDGKPFKVLKEKKSIPEKKKAKNDLTSLFTSSSEDEENDPADLDAVDSKTNTSILNNEHDIETKSMNKRAKDMLSELLKLSSDEQSDSDGDDTKKKSKNAKKDKDVKKNDSDDKSVGGNSDDDSDDFVPVKKNKRFNSKLLRAKLSDSDESYKASSDSRDIKKRKKRSTANSKGSDSSEDSDDLSDDVTSPVKSRKRRTRGNAKSSTSTDGDSHSTTKQKKRRRIKTMPDSSDSDVKVVEDKNGTPSGKGRKNIRRLLKDTKLRDDTKNAAREEEERRARVAELQKKYNVVVVSTGKDGAPITQKLVLEKDPETKKPFVEVHPELITKLKPHQVDGVKFLWESMCESVERLQTHHGSGCILAHCMGLGKTLQVITFLHTLLANDHTCIKTALVVCPLNTVVNWFMEFRNWLDEIDPPLEVMELSSVKSNYERARAMKHWSKQGGIMIIGYEMFRNLVQEKAKRMPKSCRETFQSSLINPGPDIVVCDEGHLLKNSTTSLSKAMSRVGTRRRVVLTGTPLQNNLAEYHCMVDFVKPNLLGTMKEFKNRFVNPIQNGQCADSTAQDVRIMKRRAHILHNLLDGCVQRRDYNVLTPFLPQKHEYVISIRLTEIQVKLYVFYLENLARKSARSSSLFSDYQQLMRIWTHPRVIRLAEIRQENKIRMEQGKRKITTTECMNFPNGQRPTYDDSDNSFIDDGSTDSESDSNVVCIDNDEEPSTSKGRKKGDGTSDDEVVNNWKSRSRGGRQNANAEGDLDKMEPLPVQSTNWWTEFISEDDAKKFEHSGKLILLFSILKECYNIGDKLLLFSQSLLSLDLIETMLQESQEFNEDGTNNEHYAGRWVNGTDYFRLDGSTSADTRSRYTRIFNDTENITARLFLISTRAGSLGINLVAANRVIVFDASWNPSHDVQSIFRVYRFGQEKPVYVYRFLAQGTMEEKIYDRQVTKQSLACRVVDEQQIERHFNFSDLQELYAFTPERVNKRPTPVLPKDRLLAELLIKKKDLIVSYHEHDSLLVNQEAEELDEEERKAAWVEYEVERKGMMDASGQQMSQGLYGYKLDVASIIHGIQEKEPGLSISDLTAKLHDTVAAIHLARRQALEQQRQELLRVQMQNQQREIMAAQQKRDIMSQVQQRIAVGDLTPDQIAWYTQVMGPDQSQLSKLLAQHSNPYATSGNPSANSKPASSMLQSYIDSFKNAPKK